MWNQLVVGGLTLGWIIMVRQKKPNQRSASNALMFMRVFRATKYFCYALTILGAYYAFMGHLDYFLDQVNSYMEHISVIIALVMVSFIVYWWNLTIDEFNGISSLIDLFFCVRLTQRYLGMEKRHSFCDTFEKLVIFFVI